MSRPRGQNNTTHERDERIRKLHKSGVPTEVLRERFGLTARRIGQIVRSPN